MENLTKFEYRHADLLNEYLSANRDVAPLFCLHITWLARGQFFFGIQDDVLHIYKKSQIFGKPIFYHMGHPLHLKGDKEIERKATLALLAFGVDISMSEAQINYLGLEDHISKLKKDKTPPEYIYHSEDFESLEGGRWKKWRYALKQAQEAYHIRIFESDNLPALVEKRLNEIVAEWKGYKDKYVNRHSTWYAKDIRKLKDTIVTVYYDKEAGEGLSNPPVYFNISQRVGDTVFVLDIKMARDRMSNSDSLAKAAHLFMIGYWRKKLDRHFYMLTGVGDKEYKHDGKTFDLDKNKTLLRPRDVTPMYKVRAN